MENRTYVAGIHPSLGSHPRMATILEKTHV
jgi:hypothetical protein